MAVPYYKAIAGRFTLVGKEPDGDSVRFIANDLSDFSDLHRSYRIRPARTDGSVQLRFEAVDTPEVHYGSYAQPMGESARNEMLRRLGFDQVTFDGDVVTSSTPEYVEGMILSKAADANGRPICYVITGNDLDGVIADGWLHVGEDILRRTINWFLLGEGHAYYTVYTSTPLSHREILRPIAKNARNDGRGVWSTDDTSDFHLIDHDSIGAEGDLILPKLFRRCTDYLKAVRKGYPGELTDWLSDNTSGARPENDLVLLDGIQGPIPFSTLIDQRNDRIALETDLLSMTFVEK